ncbi:MAG TPA: LamG domain-containing protein [Methanoregulaceae archaeon]|nr:LamG domain-containing protein [Methanoregulaceae archaeon]
MKIKELNNNSGVSDVVGTILIILLVIGLAAVVAAFLMPNLFPKSVYIASEVGPVNVVQPGGLQAQVLYMLPKAGEPFYLSGQQKPSGGARVTMKALSPDGRNMTPVTSEVVGNPYGQTLYIYPNNTPGTGPCDCVVSPHLPMGAMRLMTNGKWTIQLIDEDAHILVMSNSDGIITQGTSALPMVGGMLGGNVYYSNCSTITPTPDSNAPISPTLGPGNMSYRTFNGQQFMSYPDDPNLKFTGDMSISLWYNPSNVVPYSGPNGVGWHQLIGKGVTNNQGSSSSNENDNYQVFQLGDRLLFEWNDASTGQHYQGITTTSPVQANQWNYLTVTVQNGQLSIYNNGVPQPLVYDNSNVPDVTSGLGPVPVNLENNNYPVRIGEQNYSSNPSDAFYFQGGIGNLALYNRALTSTEIQQNYQNYGA